MTSRQIWANANVLGARDKRNVKIAVFGKQLFLRIAFNPRPCTGTLEFITRTCRGEGDTTPARFETDGRRANRKKTADCSRRVLAIGGTIFDTRSFFNPVLGVKDQSFAKSANFQIYSRIFQIIINRCSIKPSRAYSPFNSVQTFFGFPRLPPGEYLSAQTNNINTSKRIPN